MPYRHFHILLIFTTILTACKQKANDFYLSGEWNRREPYYMSSLIFSKDSTFKFYEQGCLSFGYTEGKYTVNENQIFLQSFIKFKDEKRVDSTFSSFIKQNQDDVPKLIIIAGTMYFPTNPTTVYFERLLLTYLNDTLYKKEDSRIEKAYYTRHKNNL